AKDQRSKFVRLFLGPPLRQLDEDRVDVLVPPGEAYPVDHVGTVLARCEPLRGLARGPGRERIDAGPADSRLLARRIGMNREEQVRAERPGDLRTLLEGKEPVVVAGHRDAHPASAQELVSQGAREADREGLFPGPG